MIEAGKSISVDIDGAIVLTANAFKAMPLRLAAGIELLIPGPDVGQITGQFHVMGLPTVAAGNPFVIENADAGFSLDVFDQPLCAAFVKFASSSENWITRRIRAGNFL